MMKADCGMDYKDGNATESQENWESYTMELVIIIMGNCAAENGVNSHWIDTICLQLYRMKKIMTLSK